MDKLLIIGGGIEQVRAYEVAHEMGLLVIGSDADPNAPALKLADYKIIASTRDIQKTARMAKEYRPNGVMTLAHDVPLTVATVAHELGLPGISLGSARLASNKLEMKWKFIRDGVPTPPPFYPMVIKPVNGSGARGVMRITEGGSMLAEMFIEGLQLSTESMMYQGRCYTVSISERNYDFDRFAPYMIEDGGVIPARLSLEETASVENIVAQTTKSLGIKNGPVKGDIVLSKDGPVVIEMAARLSGGYLCTDQIPLARGVDLVKQTIKLALGRSLDTRDLIPQDLCCIGVRYFFPKPGRIVSIKGFDELQVTKKMLFKQVGDIVEPVTDHTKRVGFVHTIGRTQEEAEQRAIQAVNSVIIETEVYND